MARKKLAAQQAQARMHVSNVAQAKMAQMQRQQQQGGIRWDKRLVRAISCCLQGTPFFAAFIPIKVALEVA